MTHCIGTTSDVVLSFGRDVSQSSSTSIKLLNDIDRTVDYLAGVQKMAEGFCEVASQLRARLVECQGSPFVIDPAGEIATVYSSTEELTKAQINILKARMGRAYEDKQLKGEHLEAVVSSHALTIEKVGALHDALVELRWAILEHDATLEKPEQEAVDSAEGLISLLRA